MGRIACILVADFPSAALMRANPELRGARLTLSRSLAPHCELIATSAGARAAGVRAGMTIAQARSIVPTLTVALRSSAAERSAADALADVAESLSPIVEPGEDGCVWLELSGLERLCGSESEIAAELVRRAGRVGMDAAVGVAANKEIARLAARCGGIRVIEPGKEAEFLNWLPLEVLELDDGDEPVDLETTLARWGIRRLGDFARLDPAALGSRLGRHGVELFRLARSEENSPLVPRRRAEVFAEAIELDDYGIENLEALSFVMRPMIERLTERLALRGLAAGGVLLSLGLGGHRNFSRRIAIGASSNDVRAILTLITLNLEASPPEGAVETIKITLEPKILRAAQADLFLPPSPAPDRLETTIARLAALCGPDCVGLFRPQNSYRPEAVRLDRFDPPPPRPDETGGTGERANAAQLVIRAVRPPIEVEVLLSCGMPEFVRGPNLGARVVSIAGPWRREGEWWSGPYNCAHARPAGGIKALSRTGKCSPLARDANGFRRDYYELALADGAIYRVFLDLGSERWFLDGVYD